MRVLAQNEQKVKLDVINQKLLYLLAQNARYSYSTLAKQVKLSREAVKQRMQRLQEKQVILGFQTLIDPQKLGLASFHLFMQLNNPQQAEEISTKLTADGDINALIQYQGRFDFEVAYLLKDLPSLNQKITELKDIRNYELCFLLKTIISKTYPQCMYDFKIPGFKVSKDGSFQSHFSKAKGEKIKLDQHDLKLLQLLCQDARMSTVNLASKLKLSVDTVIYRIKKLISAQIIQEFRPTINYAALGYSVYALFFRFKNLTKEKEAKFKQYIQQHRNFLWSVQCLGPFNNISYIIVKDTFDFHKVVNQFREEFHDVLDSYESLLSFAEYKYTYFPERILNKK
ncbi:MAG: Lrp/AsnC family transcriptional regulator [Nanoarchaeota archaeon]|nr:Lrp/AsnC family transcriptional regulator [Nanoarchaeota archaeon]MBU1622990.1 Lrp/AsnC family transcriptional regulator [Nanoarchaeota archaeon]MBU1974429.1 Lrp/AsnC family transcriptional regulator [Nanoarchaeota archaeon]